MSDSCALDACGNLKDASEIEWFNDVDDDVAMNDVPATAVTSSASTMSTSTAPLNAFSILLQKGQAPAAKTAGACRSSRTSKPSGRLRDAQESTAQSNLQATLNKRPAITDDELPMPIHKSMKVTVEDTDDDEGDDIFEAGESDEMPELVDNSDDEDNEPQAAYDCTKAMGDTDCEVHCYHTLLLVRLTSICRLRRRH